VSKFLFGDGFAVAGGDNWRVRRKAVGPALHRAYLETMIERVFAPSGVHLNTKLQVLLKVGEARSCRKPQKSLRRACCKHAALGQGRVPSVRCRPGTIPLCSRPS